MPPKGTEALICIEVATGVIKGIGLGVHGAKCRCNSQGTSPFAMDGKVFVYGASVFDATPDSNGLLKRCGDLDPRCMRCTFPTGADGPLYVRPEDDSCLVRCWDLRAEKQIFRRGFALGCETIIAPMGLPTLHLISPWESECPQNQMATASHR